MYEKMLRYVKRLLITGKNRAREIEADPFRSRANHTERVLMWVDRLLEGDDRVDKEATRIAAIFHDSGYALFDRKERSHARASAKICARYLRKHGFDADRIRQITYLVAKHSNKKLLSKPGIPRELVALIEADLLDETGSLGVLRDCLHEGRLECRSYTAAGDYVRRHAGRILDANPLRSRKGRKYWTEKQRVLRAFLEDMRSDTVGAISGIVP